MSGRRRSFPERTKPEDGEELKENYSLKQSIIAT
jgi:hypothetical protein